MTGYTFWTRGSFPIIFIERDPPGRFIGQSLRDVVFADNPALCPSRRRRQRGGADGERTRGQAQHSNAWRAKEEGAETILKE